MSRVTRAARPRRLPTIVRDTVRNPWFAAGAFGLSAWAYVGMSHTIADYEGPQLGYALGVAYEALVIGMAWEGRRRADQALDADRAIEGHRRWLVGAICVGVLSGALAAWHGYFVKGEGLFAVSRAVAPVLAAVAVHLFFQSAASARNLERKAQIAQDQETAVLDMLDAVRLAQIAPAAERDALIGAVNAAVTRVHRSVPAAVTKQVTAPHLESERTIHAVIREATGLAATWFDESAAAVSPVPVDDLSSVTAGAPPAAPDAGVLTELVPSGLVTGHDTRASDTVPTGQVAADVSPATRGDESDTSDTVSPLSWSAIGRAPRVSDGLRAVEHTAPDTLARAAVADVPDTGRTTVDDEWLAAKRPDPSVDATPRQPALLPAARVVEAPVRPARSVTVSPAPRPAAGGGAARSLFDLAIELVTADPTVSGAELSRRMSDATGQPVHVRTGQRWKEKAELALASQEPALVGQ